MRSPPTITKLFNILLSVQSRNYCNASTEQLTLTASRCTSQNVRTRSKTGKHKKPAQKPKKEEIVLYKLEIAVARLPAVLSKLLLTRLSAGGRYEFVRNPSNVDERLVKILSLGW